MDKITQYRESEHGTFVIEMPGDSFTKAEEYVKKGKFQIVNFITSEVDKEFRECYYEEVKTPDHIITYTWPTSWGFYGNKDGWMIWVNPDYMERHNTTPKEYALKEIQTDLNKRL